MAQRTRKFILNLFLQGPPWNVSRCVVFLASLNFTWNEMVPYTRALSPGYLFWPRLFHFRAFKNFTISRTIMIRTTSRHLKDLSEPSREVGGGQGGQPVTRLESWRASAIQQSL